MLDISVTLVYDESEGLGKETANTYKFEWPGEDIDDEKVEQVAEAMEVSENEARSIIRDRQEEPPVNTLYIQKSALDDPANPPREIEVVVS